MYLLWTPKAGWVSHNTFCMRWIPASTVASYLLHPSRQTMQQISVCLLFVFWHLYLSDVEMCLNSVLKDKTAVMWRFLGVCGWSLWWRKGHYFPIQIMGLEQEQLLFFFVMWETGWWILVIRQKFMIFYLFWFDKSACFHRLYIGIEEKKAP